jgi:tetratricopeptide (TPR) repeat protein
VVLAGFAWMIGLAALTWQQLPVWRDADEIWKRAVSIDPDCAFCHGQMGALAGNRGDLDSAIAHFERVVALRPANVHHRRNLGLALLKAHRPAEAAAQFELILAREPADVETRTRLGLALAEQGKPEQAHREFERASRDDPGNAGALTYLGISLIELGRPAEAVAYLEKALSLDSTSGLARAALARARGTTAR